SGAVSPTASIEIPRIVQASVRHNVTDSAGDRGLSCHCGASGSIVSSLVFLVASFMYTYQVCLHQPSQPQVQLGTPWPARRVLVSRRPPSRGSDQRWRV